MTDPCPVEQLEELPFEEEGRLSIMQQMFGASSSMTIEPASKTILSTYHQSLKTSCKMLANNRSDCIVVMGIGCMLATDDWLDLTNR